MANRLIQQGDFWYIGSLRNKNSSGKFTPSIYSNQQGHCHYCHVVSNDLIVGFEEVMIEAALKRIEKPIKVTIGKEPIFSYTDEHDQLYFGPPEEFDRLMIEMLYNSETKPNNRLMISSFLNLHGKTFDLLQEKQKQLQERGIDLDLDIEDFLSTRSISSKNLNDEAQNLIAWLKNKFETLRKSQPEINIGDLALFEKSDIHLGPLNSDIESFIEHSGKDNQILSSLINNSLEQERINQDSLKLNPKFYAYVLNNSNVDEASFNIGLSSQKTTEPVLKISYDVEAFMSNANSSKKPKKQQGLSFEDIKKEFDEIVKSNKHDDEQ